LRNGLVQQEKNQIEQDGQ